ncbi:MAG: serine protein kinase PrkA, partial [Desulfobacterales bacterium]|nr:serine protein kinase PrkA [Desulfobacterales bacterium]
MGKVKKAIEALNKGEKEAKVDIGADDSIKKAMLNLNQNMSTQEQRTSITFETFLKELVSQPKTVTRNIFQVFHDMMKAYVGEGVDEYPDDPESINFAYYDCNKLFVEGTDNPFFADRLFANRLVNLVESLKRGAQQNKIYIFKGPPGCGKSTFLNNMLTKFEEYANTEAGFRYETVWRFDSKTFGQYKEYDTHPVLKQLTSLLENADEDLNHSNGGTEVQHSSANAEELLNGSNAPYMNDDFVEIPCPSHDNPLLMIPKHYRREFFDDLFKNDKFKWQLSTEKEYEWVFRDQPCTICSSLYEALLSRLKSPQRVFEMLYARPYRFSRRLGEGISVFNPGDHPMKQNVLSNMMLQRRINKLL